MSVAVRKDSRRGGYMIVDDRRVNGDGPVTLLAKGFKTKKEAQGRAAEIIADQRRGDWVEATDKTLGDWLEEWLAHYLPQEGIESTTRAKYESHTRCHLIPDLGHLKLQALAPQIIQRQVSKWSESYSKGTVQGIMVTLGKSLRKAMSVGLIRRNPLEGCSYPKAGDAHAMTVLDEAKAVALLDSVEGTALSMPVLIGLTTGMRRGEIVALQWADIDHKRLTVSKSMAPSGLKNPKSKRGFRNITIPDELVVGLFTHKLSQDEHRSERYWKEQGYVLTEIDGSPLNPTTLSSRFHRHIKKHGKALGIEGLRFHDLRHTHVSQLIKAGMPITLIAERLGHDKSECMETYAHLLPGMDAAAADAVDSFFARMRATDSNTDFASKLRAEQPAK